RHRRHPAERRHEVGELVLAMELAADHRPPRQRRHARRHLLVRQLGHARILALLRGVYLSCSIVSAMVVPKQATDAGGFFTCASRTRSSLMSAPRAFRYFTRRMSSTPAF